MDDPDLAAIRAQRLAQLQGNKGGGANPEQMAAQEEQKRDMEARRDMMLQSMMTSEARERLARIAMVKPTVAAQVENQLLSMAQQGRLKEKVSEATVKQMLAQNTETRKSSKISIVRKKKKADSDDDDDEDNWDDM